MRYVDSLVQDNAGTQSRQNCIHHSISLHITFPITMDTKTALRIQGIPHTWKFEDLFSAITQLCDQREAGAISAGGWLMPAAEPDIHSQVAILQFNSQFPAFLKPVLDDPTGQTTFCNQLGVD